MVLDGDKMRAGLCSDLGFDLAARRENIRRVAEVAKLFNNEGWIVIAALISPLREDRLMARDILGEQSYAEVYCKCSLQTCETRDVKGLYRRARAGEIGEFTGISSPYEPPLAPHLVIDTEELALTESTEKLHQFIRARYLGN